MESVKKAIRKARYSYRALPDKKQYIEFFTALLTVPVLLTVIVLNVSNLTKSEKEAESKPQDTRPIVITTAPVNNTAPVITQEPDEECIEEVGPVTITYPEEGSTVDDNPLSISIRYDKVTYCPVVWSYRINNGRYSDFDDKSIALYNPPNGNIIFDLRVRSLISGDEKILKRTFTYEGTPTASGSAN